MRRTKALLAVLTLILTGCPKNQYQNLAVASDTIAHALKNVEDGVNLGVENGVVTQQEKADLDEYIVKTAEAGKALDSAIRSASTSGASVQTQVDAFLTAFRQLQTQGLGIKNGNVRLAVNLALVSAEGAVAIVSALGGKK